MTFAVTKVEAQSYDGAAALEIVTRADILSRMNPPCSQQILIERCGGRTYFALHVEKEDQHRAYRALLLAGIRPR